MFNILGTTIAYAADYTNGAVACKDLTISDLTTLISFLTCTIMNALIPLLMSLAVVGFVYGIIKYFLNPNNEEGKKKGKDFMLWGLIAMFVIVTFWGIVRLFTATFGVGNPVIPHLPESTSMIEQTRLIV